jgi:rubredoxin-NAD+ reductase
MTTIIIGTGQAGCSVARELRRRAPDAPILLLTADDGRVYSKPSLSSAFKDGKTPAQLVMQDLATFAAKQKLEALPHAVVRALDIEKKTVLLQDGTTRTWSQLVLAVGAAQRDLPIPGADRIRTVNSLADYEHFRATLAPGCSVAVIGAGLIGCEFAHDLTTAGHRVTVVEPLGWPLPTLIPEAAGRTLQSAMAGMGVTWIFGRKAMAVTPAPEGSALELDDGSRVEAHTVLAATGLRPRTELAQAAGIVINRGICTDRHLRTSAPDVYAIGDCAETEGRIMPYIMPIMCAARAVGATLAGQPTAVAYPVMPVVVKTPICPVIVATPSGPSTWEVETTSDGVTARARDAAGRQIGFVLAGAAATMQRQMELAAETVNPWTDGEAKV